MRMIPSLVELYRRQDRYEGTWPIKRGFVLDLDALELRAIENPIVVPDKISKRGSGARTKPNFFFDSAKYALSIDGGFLQHCLDIAIEAKDREAQERLQAYMRDPLFSQKGLHALAKGADPAKPILVDGKPVKLEDWIILTFGAEPLAMRTKILAERARVTETSVQDGTRGFDVVMGEAGVIARIHPEIAFGSNGGSSTNLISSNEGAQEYHGEKQCFNCPMTLENAAAYPRALKRQFREAAFFTDKCAIVSWPNEGTQHPIIPLIKAISTKYLKLREREAADALWAEVEALTDLDAEIHLAALQHKMGRTSVRGYTSLSARQLQINLLKFRECFRSVPVIPITFRWVLPHSTDRGTSTISDVCLLDTAWAVLTGGQYSPHLRTTLQARINQTRKEHDWSPDDAFLTLYLRWMEVLDFGDEQHMTMNTEISERAQLWIENAHASIRRELETHLLTSVAYLRVDWVTNPHYAWGRFLAVSCALKTYYHSLYHEGKKLPRPRDEALRRGIAQPLAFLGSYRPDMYLEQLARRLNARNPLLNTYQCLFEELSTPPAVARFNQAESSAVRYGFIHQMRGIEMARALNRGPKPEQSTPIEDAPALN